MLQVIFFPLLTLVILFILGFGITQLALPKQLRPYSLWLAPWFSIVFIIIVSVILGFLNLSVKHAVFLISGVLMLINLYVLFKTKFRYIFTAKEDIVISLFVVISILFNISPLLIRDKTPTAISFGNNDVLNYVIASDDVANNSLYRIFMTPLGTAGRTHTLNRGGYRWGPGLLTAFFQQLFRLEPYQYVYLFQSTLFSLSLPLLYLIFKALYKPNVLGLVLILTTMGLNSNLLYMLYNNFFGQVLFWGLELFILFFIFIHFSSKKEEKNKFNKNEFIIGAALTALYFSYHEGLIFVIAPLAIFFLLRLILKKNISFYFYSLLRIFFTAFFLGSYAIVNATVVDYVQYFAANQNQPIGWELFRNKLPYANPFEMMGFYSIHSFEPLPVLLAISLSAATILIMIFGYQKSKGKLIMGCFLAIYIFFLIWMGVLNHNFFAYNRALTYILPVFLLLFSIGIASVYNRKKSLFKIVLLMLILLEIFSALKLNKRFIKGYLTVDKGIVSIREILKTNINEKIYSEVYINKNLSIWQGMWMNHLLYYKTKFKQPPYKDKVPDNGLILLSKPTSIYRPFQILLKTVVWENEYFKLGRLCNSDECLMGRSEDLSLVEIGRSAYEDSLLINGWSVKEPESRWAFGKESTLRLVNKKPVTRLVIETLTLKEPQGVLVYIDNKFIGKQNIKTNWQEYSYNLQEPLSQGVHNVLLKYSNIYRPIDLGISPDARELSVNFKSIKLK